MGSANGATSAIRDCLGTHEGIDPVVAIEAITAPGFGKVLAGIGALRSRTTGRDIRISG
jgi:hypothetical protein